MDALLDALLRFFQMIFEEGGRANNISQMLLGLSLLMIVGGIVLIRNNSGTDGSADMGILGWIGIAVGLAVGLGFLFM